MRAVVNRTVLLPVQRLLLLEVPAANCGIDRCRVSEMKIGRNFVTEVGMSTTQTTPLAMEEDVSMRVGTKNFRLHV